MLRGVVHGVDLRHAAGQVTQEPGPDFSVDALAGGQESGDFVHTFAESSSVLSQHRRICVQGCCETDGKL